MEDGFVETAFVTTSIHGQLYGAWTDVENLLLDAIVCGGWPWAMGIFDRQIDCSHDQLVITKKFEKEPIIVFASNWGEALRLGRGHEFDQQTSSS